jgi:Raf kinase inhibitor-like YbhB/YbcL family protein
MRLPLRLSSAAALLFAGATVAMALVVADAGSQGQLTVTSPAFLNGGFIPVDFSCDGRGNSPPLAWSAPPPGTKSIAIVVDDPDAANGRYVHWLIYDVPPGTTGIKPDADARKALPLGAVQGKNGKGGTGWLPVCPPPPSVHHYHFRVFALGDKLTLSQPSEDDLIGAMRGHVLAQGETVGMFQRQGH